MERVDEDGANVTVPSGEDQLNSYQWMLRALGTYLDAQPSCRISMAETPEGFLVRLQRALQSGHPDVFRFDRETLKEQLDHLMAERKAVTPARHQGVWTSFPSGHADFFRALGYELDQESAQNVLIDELEDGIIVVFSKPGASGWQRHMVQLSTEDIEGIINNAFERRHKAEPTASS